MNSILSCILIVLMFSACGTQDYGPESTEPEAQPIITYDWQAEVDAFLEEVPVITRGRSSDAVLASSDIVEDLSCPDCVLPESINTGARGALGG